MEISFSQSFLDNLERIDNKIVIDKFKVDQGEFQNSFNLVCHDSKVQVCVEGISGECRRLDFYSGEELDFTITGENIIMNPERTIFEFNLLSEPKAIIECPWVTEDTKFLESIGTDLGSSLYKDIPISKNSLVWKGTLGKYVVDRGLQDNHLYDVELLDTKSGILEERPIRFKSYQNIKIEQGNWEIDMIKKSIVVKQDVYTEISSSSFLVWDSPMIDAKVNLDEEPECIDRIGEYVDPWETIYGNTDCFQFTNYQSSLVGFRITGTEGSKVEVLFNRESTNGNFTSFSGVIGEDGIVEIRLSDLPYLHFNGIRAIGPSKVTKIETIMYLEKVVDEYIPNPDKIYVAKIKNTECYIDINGVCDYIEYEKYLGEIREIGRGTESINSISSIIIKPIFNEGLDYEVLGPEKQILVKQSSVRGAEIYTVFQVAIDNNIEVNGNVFTTSSLFADYKIRIEQTGIIWKIYESPDYINGEDEYGIYLLGHSEGSIRGVTIMTNSPYSTITRVEGVTEDFKVGGVSYDTKIIDGELWTFYEYYIETLSNNNGDSWRPKREGTNDPVLISFYGYNESIPYVSLYAIQLREIENPIKVWEETIIPGKFTEVEDSKITLQNSTTANFIITKTGGEEINSFNWYYYDLLGTNQFYITDRSFQITNVGIEYLIAPETTVLDLGTGDLRSTYGRVINVNRSNITGSIGSLVVTESSAYPRSWRDLIDNNTVSIEVKRVIDNIYIQVGPDSKHLKNEDYEVELDSIKTFSVGIISNFKYIIQSYGYLRIYQDDNFSGRPSSELIDRVEELDKYNSIKYYTFALIKFDKDKDLEESYIEIRSGNLVRKIIPKIVGPKNYHNYLFYWPEDEGGEVSKPNIIRIYNNGTVADSSPKSNFYYKSNTTPKIETSGLEFSETTDSYFYNDNGNGWYGYHESSGTVSIPNSKFLSYSKYPMKSFGYIREMSKDYSGTEKIDSGEISYIEYPFFIKGKEHYLWCVESLSGFSSLSDPEFPIDPTTGEPGSEVDIRKNVTLDAKGSVGKTFYVVSRYDINNKTFITEYPEETEFKIRRGELEANIKISSQQNIGLDERSQIEYAIPIQVSCNVENNRGNIFLGSLDYKAETKITDESLSDVIEVNNNIATLEGIDSDYIKEKITRDKIQNLSIMIFQLGTDKTVFDLYSRIPDLGVLATSNYIIPEIGSSYKIVSFNCELSSNSDTGGGADVCHISSTYDSNYFLVTVTSDGRVGTDDYWYEVNMEDQYQGLPMGSIKDTDYAVHINASVLYGEETIEKRFNEYFKKYGYNYGLYVNGMAGFGNIESDISEVNDFAMIEVSSEGGSILIHAGIFNAVNGIDTTEALMVPSEYKFIGENQPIEFSWIDGNLDDDGNLRIVLPPRTRDEDGNKQYILQVTQPHEYYPINLYIIFYQPSWKEIDPNPDTEYRLMFLDNEVDIWSDGTVINGDGKLKFVHNLSEDAFDNVYFQWRQEDESPVPSGDIDETTDFVYLDNLGLEEKERSFTERYVKFKFKPNGSRVFIDGYIEAWLRIPGTTSVLIGKIKAKQGYYCLCAEYHHPNTESEGNTRIKNYLSREFPKPIRTFKVGEPPEGYYETIGVHPCKTQKDNSRAQTGESRGVFKLTSYRREYNETDEIELSVSDVLKNVELLSISPETIFESYSVSFTSTSSEDHDAKVDPIFFDDSKYITDTNFSQFLPYLEINYVIKDEYFREKAIIGARCKVTLGELDTGNFDDFYFFFTINTDGSNEPQDVNLLEFSDYSVSFGYSGGTKEISFSPASFVSLFTISQTSESNWVTVNMSPNSNYISVTAAENKTTEINSAFFRTGQIKIDVKDIRVTDSSYILKSFYIDTNQEPDIAQTSGGSGGGGTGSSVKIEITFKNERSQDIKFIGSVGLEFGSYITQYVTATLPGTNPTVNGFTVAANSSSIRYEATCTSLLGDVNDFLGNTILDCSISTWISPDTSSTSALLPYTMTRDDGGSLVFEKNKSYTVTFS